MTASLLTKKTTPSECGSMLLTDIVDVFVFSSLPTPRPTPVESIPSSQVSGRSGSSSLSNRPNDQAEQSKPVAQQRLPRPQITPSQPPNFSSHHIASQHPQLPHHETPQVLPSAFSPLQHFPQQFTPFGASIPQFPPLQAGQGTLPVTPQLLASLAQQTRPGVNLGDPQAWLTAIYDVLSHGPGPWSQGPDIPTSALCQPPVPPSSTPDMSSQTKSSWAFPTPRRRNLPSSSRPSTSTSTVSQSTSDPPGIFTSESGRGLEFFVQVALKNRATVVTGIKVCSVSPLTSDIYQTWQKHGGKITSNPSRADYVILSSHSTDFGDLLNSALSAKKPAVSSS